MTIEQLLYLVDVSETQSINQSANRLHISHQGISKALKNLENELSICLINRSRQGVSLTADGYFMVEKAKGILNIYDEIKLRFPVIYANNTSQFYGNLTIACIPRIVDSYLNDLLSRFKAAYPQITVLVKSLSTTDIISQLEAIDLQHSPIQIGLCAIYDKDKKNPAFRNFLAQSALSFTGFSSEEIFSCVHKNFFSKIPDCIQRNVIDKYPLITYSYHFPFHFNDPDGQNIELSSIEAQRNMIESQLGMGMITNKEFEKFYAKKRKFVLIPLCESVLFHFGYLLRSNQTLTPEAMLFIQFVNDYFSVT